MSARKGRGCRRRDALDTLRGSPSATDRLRSATPREGDVQTTRFPAQWDGERVRRVLAHYELQTEDEAVAEDGAAFEDTPQITMGEATQWVPPAQNRKARYQAHQRRGD